MSKIRVLSLLLALSACACVSADIDSSITRYSSQLNIDGSYAYDVAQSNGAEVKEVGIGGEYATGSYQFVSPEGQLVQVSYQADEHGFRPVSDALPTPPPIPAYILRALEYIRTHPTAEEQVDQLVRAQQL